MIFHAQNQNSHKLHTFKNRSCRGTFRKVAAHEKWNKNNTSITLFKEPRSYLFFNPTKLTIFVYIFIYFGTRSLNPTHEFFFHLCRSISYDVKTCLQATASHKKFFW